MKLLLIQFDDPTSLDGWRTKKEIIDDFGEEKYNNEIVGFLIDETKTHIYLASHTADNYRTFAYSIRIPKSIISRRKILNYEP